MTNCSLSKEEILYFYNLLYKYEYDSYFGFQDEKALKLVGDKISFDDKHVHGENITQETDKCL